MRRFFRRLAALRAWQLTHQLRPAPGEVLIFRSGTRYSMSVSYFMHQWLCSAFPQNRVLVLPDGMSLEHIPDDQLHRFGLHRLQPGDVRASLKGAK